MDKALAELERLAAMKNAWLSIAQVTSEAIEATGWPSNSVAARRWLGQAAAAAGISENTLARMITVRDFLKQIGQDSQNQGMPFSTLEILKRIHSADPQLAMKLLPEVLDGTMTLRELRIQQEAMNRAAPEHLTSERTAAQRDAMEFRRESLFAIRGHLNDFLCKPGSTLKTNDPGMDQCSHRFFASTDAVAYDPLNPSDDVVGFEVSYIRPFTDKTMDPARRLIHKCSYISSFFRRYYLILPLTYGYSRAQRIANAFQVSGRLNIGVALLEPHGADQPSDPTPPLALNFVLRPDPGSLPVPDCRTLINWRSAAERDTFSYRP